MMMGTTVILLGMSLLRTVLSLDISCGRGAVSASFGSKELRCVCREGIYGETNGDERFSDIFNVKLRDLSSLRRPLLLKVSHILLSNCGQIHLIMDLANLRIDEADITDISFENINDLYINFESGGGFGSGSNYMKYVFTNINTLEMTGVIQSQNEMRMFIRAFEVGGQNLTVAAVSNGSRNNENIRNTNVIFQQIKVDTPIRLLNIQDVNTLRVVNSEFRNIQTLEVRNANTRCFLTREGSVEVDCTKNQLFYESNYITPLPRTGGVLSNPLFIVGIVLIVAVVLISILVVMYIRYHKRRDMVELLE